MALFAAVSLYAAELNVYASGLNATTTTNVISATTIDYVLNAPATALNVKLYDGSTLVATVPITGAANLTKGSHASVPVDLSNVANGTYTWALEAIGEAHNDDQEVKISAVPISNADSRGMTFDDDPESPYFGTMYIANSNAVNTISAATAELTDTVIIVNNTTYWTATKSSPMRLTIGDDGLLYASDWSDNTPNITIIDRSNNSTSVVFGGTTTGSGIYKNDQDENIHGSMVSCCVVGTGSERVLYTVEEDIAVNGKTNCIFKYNIGELASLWTDTYEVAYNNADGLLANGNHNVCSDGHGGLWISQHRWHDDTNHALCHVNAAGVKDWYSKNGQITNGGYANTYGALFVNNDKSLVFTSADKCVKVWHPVFIGNVLDTLILVQTIVTDVTTNYNVIVDPARNAYLLGTKCMWAYAAAGNNVCEIPARVANTITVTNIEQLYEIGAPNVWDPTSGVAMTKISGNVFKGYFDFTADSYFGFTTELAANNDEGGWSYISAYRYAGTEDDKVLADGSNETLVQANRSFKIEEAGKYAITVNFNTMKVSVVKIMADALYEFGDNQDAWHANVGVPMTKIEDNIFEKELTFTKDVNYFAFATEMANDDDQGAWDWLNSNVRYAGVDVDEVLDDETDTDLAKGNRSFKVLPGVYTIRVNMHDMTVTVTQSVAKVSFDSEIGYATYYNSKKGYTMPANVTGYAFNYPGAGLTQAFEAGDDVPAGVALVLAGPAGTFDLVLKTGVPAVDLANQLRGTDVDELTTAPTADEYLFYGLSLAAPEPGLLPDPTTVGFYWMAQDGGAFPNKAHKAYLALMENVFDPAFLAPAILFNENNATNIQNIEGQEKAVKFIQNGQLYIQKNGVVYDAMGRVIR